MKKVNRKKGLFSISVVAEMFGVHQQTIRLYEKQGLITPKRSAGNTRLFSEDDIDRLEEIIYLTHDLGINIAGVEMILKLKRQIKKMQSEMNKVFDSTQDELDKQVEHSRQAIQSSGQRLLKIRQEKLIELEPETHKQHVEPQIDMSPIDTDQWEIEYED